MSFLSGITDALGSALGGIGDAIGLGSTSPTDTSSGGSSWDSNLYGTLLESGLGLAGIYFQQSQQKKLAEAAAKQRMAEIEAQMKLKGGGGGGGAGAAMKLAKLNNLAQLYQNYANLVQKGGSDIMEGAIKTADVATAPIMASIGRLR